MLRNSMITGLLILLLSPVFAQNVQLELLMPGSSYTPGTPFFLDLYINNSGEALYGAQLYVALTLGTDDYWFYPTWQKYPSGVAWEDLDITEYYQVTNRIIPEFAWPNGAGAFNGAGFIAAVLHNGYLVSNVAETTFGWTVGSEPDMVYFPPGVYLRGSPEDEPCRAKISDEEFQHEVTLTRGFYIMTTETTRQMWVDLKALQPTLPNDPSIVIPK